MSEILRVLQVEDSESDAALIARLLEKSGYDVQSQRVEDPDEMRAALMGHAWDVIIADHSMARFDAPGALRVLRETGKDIPFVLVSGSIGEEHAVAIMKSGAHDYVAKDNLARLVPAVDRELRDARSRLERRQAEKHLAESQERLALAIQATQLGTFDYSPLTGTLVWSEMTKRHFGLSPSFSTVSYETFLRGLHPDDQERAHAAWQSALTPGSGGEYATEYRTRGIEDGVERHVSSWGRVYFDDAGQPVRLVGVTLDISERKRLEEQFRQAQKLESVGRLASGVAHDFNNILMVINGYSDALLGKLDADDPLRDLVTPIRDAGERGAALSAQLLVLSRKQVAERRVVNLNEIIVELERMLAKIIGEDIKLKSDLSSSLGTIMADPGQLHQVLMNLAINARDAMPSGGSLTIETCNFDVRDGFVDAVAGLKPGRYVRLKVSDTGTGMTKEVKSHLFEPFFTTKRAGQGTGLGLATVYGIVQQNEGSISIDSEPGQGTTFTIYLPQYRGSSAAKEKRNPTSAALRGNETILVVEDQEEVRELAGRVLRLYGYQVLESAHPDDALLQAERYAEPIQLMLADVVMPGMTGPELTVRMKLLRPAMRVLFMSGYSEGSLFDRQVLESVGAYLAKPFSAAALAEKVREILGSTQSLNATS
jgi:two-component system cell cycle sensor histidine kinase/response regulator CckA